MLRFPRFGSDHKVRGTMRIEAWSDAVIAIIITILIIDLHVPELHDFSLRGVGEGLWGMLPQFAVFAFSFLTLAVFWMNHHHFFVELDHSDARLMWYNNALLFFLALVPFTTSFLGMYYQVPGVLMLYAFVLTMAALTFMLMCRHAYYVSHLTDPHITDAMLWRHYRRGWIGVFCYGGAAILAPFFSWCSIALIIFVPAFYIMPRLMHDHNAMGK